MNSVAVDPNGPTPLKWQNLTVDMVLGKFSSV